MKRRDVLKASGVLALCAAGGSLAAPAVHAQAGLGKINLLVTTVPPDVNTHHFWWAQENGFYRDAGVEVSIRSILADTTTVRALVAGEADVGWAGASSGLQSMQSGAKLKILSSFSPKLDYVLVATPEVSDLKAFEGHPLAVSQLGSVSHIVAKLMIEKAGGDASKVKWVSVGSGSARLQAMIVKRVDGTLLQSQQTILALKQAGFHEVGVSAKELPDYLYSWEIVTQDALRTKPEALKAFTAANARAVNWAMDRPADAAKISEKVLPNVTPEDIAFVINRFAQIEFFNRTGLCRRENWDYTVDLMVKNGDLPRTLSYDDFVLTDYVPQTVKK